MHHELSLTACVLCTFSLQERARSLGGYVDFIAVMRPAAAPSGSGSDSCAAGGSPRPLAAASRGSGSSAYVRGGQARPGSSPGPQPELVPVLLPTGSVRASLGPLSRWEDAAALVDFLRDTYVQ
jgi:hypothetical protein